MITIKNNPLETSKKLIDLSMKSALVVWILLLSSHSALATTYYVSPTGDNSNSGLSINESWQSPSYAASCAAAGDTIYLMDGVWYGEQIYFHNKKGTYDAPIKMKAYDGNPTLNGVDKTGYGIRIFAGNWIHIEGINVENYLYGFFASSSHNLTITNCEFSNHSKDGITLWNNNHNVKIDHVVVKNTDDHGIHIWNQNHPGRTRHIIVSNSSISNAPHNLIDIHTNITDVLVTNNRILFTDNYTDIKQVGLYLHNGNINNITIKSNYFYNMPRPLEIFNSKNVSVTHNKFTNINGRAILLSGISGYQDDDDYGVFNSVFKDNTFDNVHYAFYFWKNISQYRNLDIVHNNYVNITNNDLLKPNGPYVALSGNSGFPEVLTNRYQNYTVQDIVNSTFVFIDETPDEPIPGTAGTDISFTPTASSLTSSVGESTTFAVDSGQDFTSALWYIDGKLVESDAVTHVQDWDTAGTHTVRFDGIAAAGTITRTWTAVVSGAQTSGGNIISISPSTTVVAPGEAFTLDVYIDPTQDLTGSQFDLHYSQLATVSSVTEGKLFSLAGRSTTFETDSIDNSAGILKRVYSAIVGSGTISEPGTMATVNMLAGSSTGILDVELKGVVLSDVNSDPAAYAASGTTVLIDTAPEFRSLSSMYVEEGESLSFTVSATDADGDELSYSATSLPSGASFNAKTATLSWTPLAGDTGNYEAVFEVTDGYLQDSMTVAINVIEPNNAPVISLFEPADNSVFEEGSTVNVNVIASDEDGQSLSYVIKIDGSQVSTTSSYAWDLDYESAGTHTIEVIVSDGVDEVSASRTISITDLQPRWDVNEDGIVNILDITLVCQNYGATYTGDLPRWDVNQDGVVNIQDLSIISGRFGEIV